MQADPSPHERLALLIQIGGKRPWKSTREKRRCMACDKVFKGDDVQIAWVRRGLVQLQCPTPDCHAGPDMWVHPADPLVSAEAWEDWAQLMGDWERQEQEPAVG